MQGLGYTYVGGKKLRNGITTGTCATVATKAALEFLLTGKKSEKVEVELPSGQMITVPIYGIQNQEGTVVVSVKKDGGDDPDITNGALICAKVEPKKNEGYSVCGGDGVGRITLSGLPVPVGQPAINPVPMKMLQKVCQEFSQRMKTGGFKVTIFVPEGEALGKRTLNPKLGIVGGISILGTTGIVKPMSEEAFKESLRIEIEMYVARGHKHLILVPGNYGADFCFRLYGPDLKWPMIKISNFFGYVLEQCERLKVKKILLVGDLGKLIKVSGGIFHTHSKVADCRLELMTAYVALCGGSVELLQKIIEQPTTLGAIHVLEDEKDFPMEKLYQLIVDRVNEKMTAYCHDEIEFETILFTRQKGELGRSKALKP